MWPYHPHLLATPVPRYTSYPTAAEFHQDVGADNLADAISAATGDISLYVHIPFCEKICWYCGCNTAAANRTQRLVSYLEGLHSEIALVSSLLPASARVRRVSFGGGSPNALTAVDFVRLFDQLALHFSLLDPVVSIELDPRTLTPDWSMVLSGIGATHASLGVQTFSPDLQAAIGRVQPLEMIEASNRQVRDAGITSLNFDFMYGLPGQTLDDLTETLKIATKLAPDRIALFGYAHVPRQFPRQEQIDASDLPGQEMRFHMAETGYDLLVEAGYQPVGFDHFALPGDPLAQAAAAGRLHRNFQGFTEDAAPDLIGLGASAISSFPSLLAQNEKNSGRYRMMLSQNQLPACLGKARSSEDRRRGAIIEDLLCHGRARIDQKTLDSVRDQLTSFLGEGLCSINDGLLSIDAHGLPYARAIASKFDAYRSHPPQRFSSAV